MKKKNVYFLLVPGIVLILFFLLIPIISTILPTFFEQKSFTFKTYYKFLSDDYFMSILLRTLKIGIITTLICAFVGTPTAYFVSQSSNKIKNILLICTVFPLLTNSVVRSFAWITMLGKNGILNKALVAFQIFKEPHKFLYTEGAVITGCVYLFLPLMIVSMVGVMGNIEDDLMGAAESLGANKITAFLKVVLPLSIPGMIVGSILVFTGTFTAYTTPQLLGGNSNTVMSTFIYQKVMTLSDWNSASVISTIMIVITLFVVFIMNKLASVFYKRGV